MKRTPLTRKTPLKSSKTRKVWRRAEDDKVTPGLRQLVLARDGRCMAPVLDSGLATHCTDQWGSPLVLGAYQSLQALELDHVPDFTSMGSRAPSDQYHLIALCPFHHRLSGWATSKHGRTLERAYLQSLRPVDNLVPTDSMEQP